MSRHPLSQFRRSLAGTLLVTREAVLFLMRPALRKAGLTEQQWRVLRVIEIERECEPTTAAYLALIQLPSMTRIMRELVSRQLIERVTDPRSARRSSLRLTPEGKAILAVLAKEIEAALDPHIKLFGEARLGALMSELRALGETLAVDERGPVDFT